MRANKTLIVPFMILIMVIALNAAYAAESQAKRRDNADDMIAAAPPGVRVIPDISYREGPSKAWRLDLAMPKETSDEARPAIVFVHGGGWRSGDKRTGNFLGPTLEFAAKGYVCMTINYRLVGEAPMPACIEDVKCAVRWLRAHAKEYGVDPERIGAYGNSAGAHLVAMLGLCPRSAGLEGDGPWQEHSSMVQAVVCSATPTSFPLRRRGANEQADSARERSFRSTLFAGPEETLEHRMRQASPMTYVTADAPPFLMIHGTADRTVPVSQSDELAKALQQAGAKDVTYMRIEGAGHGVFGQHIEKTGPAREAFFARTIGSKALGTPDGEPTIKAPGDQPSPGRLNERAPAGSEARNAGSRNAERVMARWLSMDKDGDGKITKDEAQGQLKASFERNDANKDGFLDRGELDALSQRLFAGRSRGRTPGDDRSPQRQQSGRARQVQPPAGTKVERDIVYARVGDRELLLDLYLPPKRSAPLPVIVWVHGGGWRSGSKGSGGRARPMLDKGYAVVDVGYRLSGEAIFPAQVEDCKAAVRWVRANAGKYGLDPDRIGAWGSSAGGHLVAFLGTAGDVKEFDTKANAEHSSRVQAVCDWFGPTDFLQMDKHRLEDGGMIHNAPNSPESLLVGGPIQEEPYRSLVRKANPITYVTKDDPPFLIMHGDKDLAVPLHQSELLYDALKKVGVDATLYVVKGAGHGLRGGEESSETLFDIVADFFDKHLKRQEPKADSAGASGARTRRQSAPTHADVKYGPHEQNVLDFYQAKSEKPTPVAVFIHGGGFRGGSKSAVTATTLQELLGAGISVAAVEYRFVSDKPLPTAHHDSLRALQFIRSKADEWNIDKRRIGAFGGSAGAQICMWLAFHDEMADPSSRDPVERESSRLSCVATNGGQTTMDFDWWMQWIPGYDKPHRDRSETFGDVTAEQLRKVLKDISALSLISSDDPPIFMSYGMRPDDPVPTDPSRAQGWKVHHVMFGVKLKEKMDELGVEADLKYPGAQTTYGSNTDFFITKLKPDNE